MVECGPGPTNYPLDCRGARNSSVSGAKHPLLPPECAGRRIRRVFPTFLRPSFVRREVAPGRACRSSVYRKSAFTLPQLDS